MNFIKNLKVRTKLVTLVSLPVAIILFAAMFFLNDKNQLAKEMSQLKDLSNLAVRSSALVHELQKERGMTAAYLGTNGEKFSSELPLQRVATDNRKNEFNEFLNNFDTKDFENSLVTSIETMKTKLKKLETVRGSISNFNISGKEAISYYTTLNGELLDPIGQMLSIAKIDDVKQQLVAYFNFLQKKERAGIERAILSSTFANDKFAQGNFKKFIELVSAQETFMFNFDYFATQEEKDFFNTTMNNPAVDDVKNMRLIAVENASNGNFGVDSKSWFDKKTQVINLLKKVEDNLAENLTLLVDNHLTSANSEFTYSLIGLFVLMLVILLLTFTIIKIIVKPIHQISKISHDISLGNIDQKIEITSNDEIGELANNFRNLIEYLNGLKEVAEKIANNDLTVTINKKSDKDVLSIAFERMTANLTSVISQIKSSSNNLVTVAGNVDKIVNKFTLGIDDVTTGINTSASSSEEISTNMNSVAASVEQMSSNIKSLSDSAMEMSGSFTNVSAAVEEFSVTLKDVKKNSDNTAKVAEEADLKAKSASDKINSLANNADRIGKIVSSIADIADLTNLLALNATIEAASAGDAGKGFAVVANEVKELAKQTAQATQDITMQVEEMQRDTSDAVISIAEILEVNEKITELSSFVATAIDQQNSAVQEISQSMNASVRGSELVSTNAKELAQGTNEISRFVSEAKSGSSAIAKDVASSARASSEINQSNTELQQMVIKLTSETEKFDLVISEFKISEVI